MSPLTIALDACTCGPGWTCPGCATRTETEVPPSTFAHPSPEG